MQNNNMKKRFGFLIIFPILIILVTMTYKSLVWFTESNSFHKPSDKLLKDFKEIEIVLRKSSPEIISAVNILMSDLVNKEDEITALLEQKASTQMGSISIISMIILAIMGYYIHGMNIGLLQKRKTLVFTLFSLIISAFIFSIYATHSSFMVRNNFASYNLEDILDTLKEKNSSFIDFQISNILENYQIYNVNSYVNECKANCIALASWSFILGIFVFSCLSFIIVISKAKIFKHSEGD